MTSLPAGHARTTPVEARHQGDPTLAVTEVLAAQVRAGVNAAATAVGMNAAVSAAVSVGMIAGAVVATTVGAVAAMIGAATAGLVGTRTAVLAAVQIERAASVVARC